MGTSRVTAGVALVGIAVGTDFTGEPTDGAVAPETVAGAETPVANVAAGWVVADSQELDPRPNATARHAIAVTFIVFRIPRPRLCPDITSMPQLAPLRPAGQRWLDPGFLGCVQGGDRGGRQGA